MPAIATRATPPQPIYFGPSGSLFGMYHPAERVPPRPVAVVLCYAAGHEQLRVQRSFRNLAGLVTRHGFPVLRFDYGGTGDSAGDGRDATLESWQSDLHSAIEEIRRRSGATRIAIAGHRLGASLAWLAAIKRPDVELVIMWDPVIHGARYLEELRTLQRAWLAEPDRARSAEPESPDHLLGFPIGEAMARQIEALALTAGPLPRARVFAILASDDPEEAPWRERLLATYGPNSCGIIPTVNWRDPAAIHTAAYPQAALQLITKIFDKAAT